jgi:hypothetical protein
MWLDKKYWDEHDKMWNPLGEKKTNTDRIISHMNEVGSFGNDMGYEIVPETLAELFDVPPVMLNLMQGNNHKSKEKNSNDKDS